MKVLFSFSIMIASALIMQGQNVGIGTNLPHVAALLHVDLGVSSNNEILFS